MNRSNTCLPIYSLSWSHGKGILVDHSCFQNGSTSRPKVDPISPHSQGDGLTFIEVAQVTEFKYLDSIISNSLFYHEEY